MKQVIVDIPLEISDEQWPLLIFLTKLSADGREYTGYKELSDFGVDLDAFLKITGSKVNSRGAIKVDAKKTTHIIFEGLEKERYILDTDIFEFEFNVLQAFKDRDPVWFTPYEDLMEYDEDMFKQLPEPLQKWFLKKLKAGILSSAQGLLDNTYRKYVIEGKPLPFK